MSGGSVRGVSPWSRSDAPRSRSRAAVGLGVTGRVGVGAWLGGSVSGVGPCMRRSLCFLMRLAVLFSPWCSLLILFVEVK